MILATLLQDINIDEKIKNAPDSNYGIGIFYWYNATICSIGNHRLFNL